MDTRLSRDEFLRNLGESGLISTEEIENILEGLPSSELSDGESIAHCLIAAGKLTAFQATAVRERRFEELMIGNYQVLDRLGAGGMGTVYKARHRRMKRAVAIKVLAREIARSPDLVQRFQREVEAVARLSHPNIVMAHDADEAEAGDFLVMEFVDGRDLASETEKRGPLQVRMAVECIVQAARALDYAHSQGIIHRDIKPANLLRDVNGVVKVTDLGLARLNGPLGQSTEKASALTQAGTIMGTVDFMSPEQALGSTDIDHRTDIYSLGCTLFFLLLGRPPYQGPSMMATLLKHRDAPIPSLVEARNDVPASLDAIFRRMVAKEPADRFQAMAEVMAALKDIEADLGDAIASPPEASATSERASAANLSTGVWVGETVSRAFPRPAPQTIDLRPPRTLASAPQKVLLVEPSRTQSAIIRKYLQEQGVQHVAAVTSGQEALVALRNERPEAVVSALHLSDMTGVQLGQRIHGESKPPSPGFLLISSEAESSEVGTLSKCGKALHLQKPFTSQKLIEAVRLVAGVQSAPAATKPRSALRVLIVDDSAPARRHVRTVLTGLGLSQFVEAADGAQAVTAVVGGAFDLIVTDYNMPYMDGLGLIGYLRQNPSTAAIPIVMVTTEEDPRKLEAVRNAGVSAVCDKSFPPEAVRQIIDQLVSAP
jgi:serine/threonine-protein kinase